MDICISQNECKNIKLGRQLQANTLNYSDIAVEVGLNIKLLVISKSQYSIGTI